MTAIHLRALRTSTFQVLYNNSFYKGAFLAEAISWLEEKLWKDASRRRRTDPSTPFSFKCIIYSSKGNQRKN